VCHSFQPNCDVEEFQHPRFGKILCFTTLEEVSRGQELYINYK
jgi:hypothetical protein